jgi:flagellar motor switch protein FliM
MDKVLNQEEIDAMVRVARGGQAGATSPAQQVVQPWDIRQAGQIGSEQMRAINQLHEVCTPKPDRLGRSLPGHCL